MSLEDYIGRDGNLLDEQPEHCRQLRLASPVLSNTELEKLRGVKTEYFRTQTLPMLFSPEGGETLEQALDTLCEAASQACRAKRS